MTDTELREAIALLTHKHSPKRRSAAKKLRRLKDQNACQPLMDALRKEVNDPRTWETQYQIIMALGECSCKQALPFLQQLVHNQFDATMLYLALGDSIVRLARDHDNDAEPVMEILKSGNDMLIDGGLRAVAMLQLRLNREAVGKIIEYGMSLGLGHGNRFWIAAAAAGWDGSEVERFLQECARSGRADLERAATASLEKRYLKWRPL